MIALLKFSVANFRSINTKRTISFVASSIKDEPRENVVSHGRIRYLRTCAVYGANSSGKTNLMMAMGLMTIMLRDSAKLNDGDELPYDPFALSTTSTSKPTFFEVSFAKDDFKYRYGFEYDENTIVSEWLYSCGMSSSKEKVLFIRTSEGIAINEIDFEEGAGLESKTNDNRLFLSLVAQLGGENTISKNVMAFFKDFNVISGLANVGYDDVTKEAFAEKTVEAESAMKLFKDLRLGFHDVWAEEIKDDNNKQEIRIYTKHPIYNKNGKARKSAFFSMDYMESEGTKKVFELAGPIVNTLLLGRILVIDELDAKMHPLISQHLVNIFNDPEKNKNNAQLIFSTHDTHLLSASMLRRDQIWFTEKNEREETDVYCMMDILLPDGSKPRSDSNLEKNYILGRYGAIPYILND